MALSENRLVSNQPTAGSPGTIPLCGHAGKKQAGRQDPPLSPAAVGGQPDLHGNWRLELGEAAMVSFLTGGVPFVAHISLGPSSL